MKAPGARSNAITADSKPTVINFKTNRASFLYVVAALGASVAARIACRSGKTAIDAASIAVTARRKAQDTRRKA